MKKKSVLVYLAAFSGLSYIILALTPYTTQANELSKILGYSRLAYLVIAAFLLIKILHLCIKSEIKPKLKNFTLLAIAVSVVLMVAESFFMFIPRSHGAGGKDRLAAQMWFSRYWVVNSMGYRDVDFDIESIQDNFKIMVTGDSFVAGHGINDPTDRFSNLLQYEMGDHFRVFNLGRNGADTQAEYNALVQFPVKPDLIILAHHPNDIERVVKNNATGLILNSESLLYRASMFDLPVLSYFVKRSFALNYFYWKFNAIADGKFGGSSNKVGAEYFSSEQARENYLSFYLNEDLFRQHLQHLYQFIALSREESIPLAVILFPETWDETIDYSETGINQPLKQFFTNQGIHVLDTYQILKDIPVKDRVVNANDAHPSGLAHKKIADALYKFLIESKLAG